MTSPTVVLLPSAAVVSVLPVPLEVPAVETCSTSVGVGVGVTPVVATEAAPVPAALVAFTVNVYDVFAVRPVTVHGDVADEQVKLPGVDVTV
jgi:hypothetical protein